MADTIGRVAVRYINKGDVITFVPLSSGAPLNIRARVLSVRRDSSGIALIVQDEQGDTHVRTYPLNHALTIHSGRF